MSRLNFFWIPLLSLAVFFHCQSAAAQEAAPFSVFDGALRMRANFSGGEAAADFGPGERRMSRIWGGHLGRTRPWVGAVSIGDCVVPGWTEGGYAFEPKTDAAFAGLGALNAQSGTFAFWIRRSEVFQRGGMLYSAKSFVSGGPDVGIHWALGIGGERDTNAAPGRFYVTTSVPGGVQCIADEPPPDGEWVHVAAVWDADTGAKLYLNGRLAGSTWGEGAPDNGFSPPTGSRNYRPSREAVPVPVDRIHLHRHANGGAVADIHVFDAPLASEEIKRLASGETFEPGQPLRFEETGVNRAWRMRWLGWGGRLDGDLIALAPGRPLTVHEQWAERAYEDRRLAGFNAIDGVQMTHSPWRYHGYQHVSPRKLHVKFPRRISANFVVARGDRPGTLFGGGTRDEPFAGEEALELPGRPTVFRKRLEADFAAESATVFYGERRGRKMSGLHFYRVEEGAPEVDPARMYRLHGDSGAEPPLGEWKRREFVTSYGPRDRRFLVGSQDAAAAAERRPMDALRAHHFFTPTLGEDFPLSGVGLRLNLRRIARPTRMQVRVHDVFDEWRELGRWDFLLEAAPGGEGAYEIALMLRETLALQGSAFWTTVILDRDAELVSRPGDESALLLYGADLAVAERNFLEWQLAWWRTAFEGMSEPRPWGGISMEDEDSGWWLRAASPPYERMVRIGSELRRRYPGEPRVEAWFAFIHPGGMHNGFNPAKAVEVPEPGPHPRWAVLARENLALYAEFVDYWTDERAHENGEFGNWIGDDTCLLQDWPDLAMIDDPDGRYREVVRKLADGVVDGSYTTPRMRTAQIVNGLNRRWTDALHAYEDGMNMQPMAFQLDYGNPVLFHRLLETASRYDGFLLTPEEDGIRRFNSDGRGTVYWSTDREPVGDPFNAYWFLATHAGQVLTWYNGHPAVSEMFAQLGEWMFRARDEGRSLVLGGGGWYFWLSLWSRFGDERYLGVLTDLERIREEGVMVPQPLYGRPSSYADPTFVKRLPDGMIDAEATAVLSREDAEGRFDWLRGTRLGFGDRRFERNWFEWHLVRDKAHLEEGLAALYQKLKFLMPAYTVAEQSGDRVAIPKQLVSQMYLGGVPAARNNQFYPMYAASYEGMGRDFAALVLDDTEDLLRVLFYNFNDEPINGTMRVWGVGPGEFEIAGGPDNNGNERMDAVEHRDQMELVRGDGFGIKVPPQQLYVWEARRVRPGRPLWERPDLAISAEEFEWGEDGSLTVRVHNIGAVASESVPVVLRRPDGRAVARRVVPSLEAPLDMKPKTADIAFGPEEVAAALGTGGAVLVVADPDDTQKEITRRNNAALAVRP